MEAEKNDAQRNVRRTSRPSSSMICLSLYPAKVEKNTISMANQSPPNRRQNAALAKLVSVSTSHLPVGFVAFMRSKCSAAECRSKPLSATFQLSLLKRVFKSKLMPQCAVSRCAVSASARSPFHTETVTLSGMMNMPRSMPKASAMRLVFFSMRIHVDPHPSCKEAYSARNAAVSCKAARSLRLPISPALVFIPFVSNSRNFGIAGNIEHVCFPTEPQKMCRLAAAATATALGIIILDGSEEKCAQQHARNNAPRNHWIVHNLLFF